MEILTDLFVHKIIKLDFINDKTISSKYEYYTRDYLRLLIKGILYAAYNSEKLCARRSCELTSIKGI